MELVILASDRARPAPRDRAWTLRLVGAAESGEVPPPDIRACAEEAAAEIRQSFPEWLWQWASDAGATEMQVFSGPISWWWLTELSEMSPLRSPVLRQLYWLALIRILIERHTPVVVEWHGDDTQFDELVHDLCLKRGTSYRAVGYTRKRARLSHHVVKQLWHRATSFARWALLRLLFHRPFDEAADVLLFTRYPVLWESVGPLWRERMYGTWPEYLESRGHHVVYAAVYSGSPFDLLRRSRQIRRHVRDHQICFLEAHLSLRDWLGSHTLLAFWYRYWRWRRSRRQQPVIFNGLDIGAIWWREIDRNALGVEISFDLALISGVQRLLRESPAIETLYHPFEFQPMERALWSGAKSVRPVAIVGLQTGIYTANQMGFGFPRSVVRERPDQYWLAPLPDTIAAYGTLPYRVFCDRLGPPRVVLTGPIRFSPIAGAAATDRNEALDKVGLPRDKRIVVVTTSVSLSESTALLHSAFQLVAARADCFLALKFHYHLPLERFARQLAASYRVTRYRIFDSNLNDLIRSSSALVCAGSSTGLEAMRLGSMPLVYINPAEMSSNPMLDIPYAVFFWSTTEELNAAFDATFSQNGSYQDRRARWPEGIAAQAWVDQRSPNEHLYGALATERTL
jgi:hypothetical protein